MPDCPSRLFIHIGCGRAQRGDFTPLSLRLTIDVRKSVRFWEGRPHDFYYGNGGTQGPVQRYRARQRGQPFKASVRLDRALTENGVPHDCFVAEHSGHGLQNDSAVYRQYLETVLEYLKTYMPPES